MSAEREILDSLDRAVRQPRAAVYLESLAAEVAATLHRDPAARLAW